MKKLLPLTIVLFVWGCLVGACSASQKQAEGDLVKKSTTCAVSCGVEKAVMGVSAKDALSQCATKCGIDMATDPEAWKDLVRIIAGAQAGVAAARDAGADAAP